MYGRKKGELTKKPEIGKDLDKRLQKRISDLQNKSEKHISDLQNKCKKLRKRAFLQNIRHCMLREHYGGDMNLTWSKLYSEFCDESDTGWHFIKDSMNGMGYNIPAEFDISSDDEDFCKLKTEDPKDDEEYFF